MSNKIGFLFFTVMFFASQNVNARQAVNFRPINGLEVRETNIKDEGPREIVIKKNEAVKTDTSDYYGRNEDLEKNFYILLGYNNQVKTNTSDDLFGENASLNFAKPVSDRRFGGELFFGAKLGESRNLLLEIGVDYNFAYLNLKTPIKNSANRLLETVGIHAITPSLRFAYNFFTTDDFAIYAGLSVGLSVLNFTLGEEYNVQYGAQYGTLAGISYSLNETFELFLAHKYFHNPEQTFIIQNKEYTTDFKGHNINLGLKIKF